VRDRSDDSIDTGDDRGERCQQRHRPNRFLALWCGPCRSFAPIDEKAAEQHREFVFAKIDTEAEQDLAALLVFLSIPTLLIVREIVILCSPAGALPERALIDLVENTRELHMNDVYRLIRALQAADA
jgi:thioredoxin 1